jgi:hypothetical protein
VLSNNGGTTPTRALQTSSPVIDSGLDALAVDPSNGNAALASDQRGTGYSRSVDGDSNGTSTVDIGAFEAGAATSAEVTAGGRVSTVSGRGIRGIKLMVTFPNGETRTAISSKSGYYQFANLPAGDTYIFAVKGKSYIFSQPIQVRTVSENVQDINFVADAVQKSEQTETTAARLPKTTRIVQ